jgi:hypothetical protein
MMDRSIDHFVARRLDGLVACLSLGFESKHVQWSSVEAKEQGEGEGGNGGVHPRPSAPSIRGGWSAALVAVNCRNEGSGSGSDGAASAKGVLNCMEGLPSRLNKAYSSFT